MNLPIKKGWIEVIVGPMFAGKTEELIKRLTSLKYAKKEFICFKPKIDNRWKPKKIVSRSNWEIKAQPINSAMEVYQYIKGKDYYAVAFDEAQFFDKSIIEVIEKLADQKIRVIIAGLELDIHRKPFGFLKEIMSKAEFVTKLKAVCFVCGQQASFTYKVSGDPNQVIQIGDREYEARCRGDYVPYPSSTNKTTLF